MVYHILAVAVKDTGISPFGGNDVVFAIGAAVLMIDPEQDTVQRVSTHQCILRIGPANPTPASWEALWHAHGYNLCAWEAQWCNHIDELNALMASPTGMFDTHEDMVRSFIDYVDTVKKTCTNLHIMRHSIGGSVLGLCRLMVSLGHDPIFPIGDNRFDEFQLAFLRSKPNDTPADILDHSPKNIALQIAYMSILRGR